MLDYLLPTTHTGTPQTNTLQAHYDKADNELASVSLDPLRSVAYCTSTEAVAHATLTQRRSQHPHHSSPNRHIGPKRASPNASKKGGSDQIGYLAQGLTASEPLCKGVIKKPQPCAACRTSVVGWLSSTPPGATSLTPQQQPHAVPPGRSAARGSRCPRGALNCMGSYREKPCRHLPPHELCPMASLDDHMGREGGGRRYRQ